MILVGIGTYLLFFVVSFVGILKHKKKQEKNFKSNFYNKEISIVIPFRNEEKRIKPLIESINNSKIQIGKIFFIDDHSTDKTIQLIESNLKIKNFEIIHLPNDKTGKKEAINYIVNNFIDTEYFLTLDADISFKEDYFETLQMNISNAELIALPVKMKGKDWMQQLFAYDYSILTTINKICAGYYKPFTASGANLLINTESYKKYEDLKSHQKYLSGDDHFLISIFQKKNLKTILIDNEKLCVETNSPENLKNFFEQRIRWIQKNNVYTTVHNKIVMFANITIQVIYFITLFYFLLNSNWINSLILFSTKVIIDYLIISIVNKQNFKFQTVIISSLFQPFYYASLLILKNLYRPKWKNRPIIKKI
jgi:biofilm PGA synthesis N-glycosyltransferase PgaC